MCECCGGDCKLTCGPDISQICECGAIIEVCAANYPWNDEYLICPIEWIKVDKSSPAPLETPFLICDEYENVHIGFTIFDYQEAEYWFPLPKYPMARGIITNDQWVNLLGKNER